MRSKTFVQTFYCEGRLLFKHFGGKLRLLFKHFGCKAKLLLKPVGCKARLLFKDYGCKARLLFKCCGSKQDFCSKILGLKKDFCSTMLDAKQDFCSKNWMRRKTFVPTFWVQSKTFFQNCSDNLEPNLKDNSEYSVLCSLLRGSTFFFWLSMGRRWAIRTLNLKEVSYESGTLHNHCSDNHEPNSKDNSVPCCEVQQIFFSRTPWEDVGL
jgi:hypothetical protein